MYSFDKETFTGCPYNPTKKRKNWKKVWKAHVVEVKLLCENDLDLPLATQWFNNSKDLGDKQVCEQKAFLLLAQKIKQMYPAAAIIITADASIPTSGCSTCAGK